MDDGRLAGLRDHVRAAGSRRLGPGDRAVPPGAWRNTVDDYLATRPRRADLPTPVVTLDRAAWRQNVAAMAGWCADRGLELAPHGKTTMAPALWLDQLAAGATAITLATPAQLWTAQAAGVPAVHLANELADPGAVRHLTRLLDAEPGFSCVVWADDVAGVATLAAAAPGGTGRPLDVCVELGALGGRAGARGADAALAVARAVVAVPGLRLVGVAGFEGALVPDASDAARARVAGYLRELVDVHDRMRAEGLLAPAGDDALVSAGGSAFFDLVAEVLEPLRRSGTRVVLRSGVYAAHDDGFYAANGPAARGGGPVLRSALHVWGRVLSAPEPGRAVLDVGKRDVGTDLGLPVPLAPSGHRAVAVFDQHTVLEAEPDAAPLRPGDVVRCGLSHPCTTFDRWGLVPVLDDVRSADPRVVGLVSTHF